MELFKKYILNYTINLIDPSKLKNLENLNYDLQMMFSILKRRKDKLALKKYIDSNKEYFSNIDEESYQTAKAMLGSSRAFAKGKYTKCVSYR